MTTQNSNQSIGIFAALGQGLSASVKIIEAAGNSAVSVADSVEPALKRVGNTLSTTLTVVDELAESAQLAAKSLRVQQEQSLAKEVIKYNNEMAVVLNQYKEASLLPATATVQDLRKYIKSF